MQQIFNKANTSVTYPDDVGIGFILMGQSNMQGDTVFSDRPTQIQNVLSNAYIWDAKASLKWNPYHAGFNSDNGAGNGRWGLEAEMLRILPSMVSRDVFVLKYAFGGTGFYPESADNWDPSTGELASQLKFHIKCASNAAFAQTGKRIAWRGIGTSIGEHDSTNPTTGQAFEGRFRDFLVDLKKEIHPNLPVVIARLHSEFVAGSQGGTYVRTGQENIGNELGNEWVNIDDLVLTDGVHINPPGLIEKGRRFAEAFKNYVFKDF